MFTAIKFSFMVAENDWLIMACSILPSESAAAECLLGSTNFMCSLNLRLRHLPEPSGL